MAGYIFVSGDYNIEDFGIVHINIKANARSIHYRWRGSRLYATVPRGCPMDNLIQGLKHFQPQIDSIKPKSLYFIGQKLVFPEFTLEISSQNRLPDKMLIHFDPPKASIAVGTQWDMDAHHTMTTISKSLCRMAQRVAAAALVPQARQVAERVGKTPLAWSISNGHRVLGHCNSKGVIALSYALIFYPMHLREYVICHELAHLTELNHSPTFHEICNAYCLGREAELITDLHAYHPPIIR